jgi:hypothetical protein
VQSILSFDGEKSTCSCCKCGDGGEDYGYIHGQKVAQMKMIVISIPLPPTLGTMLAIARFQVPLQGAVDFRAELEAVKAALSEATGFKSGAVGQNLDEPTLWVLTTEWENVGSYRRALSSTRAKLEAIPVLARAIDEPGAYE